MTHSEKYSRYLCSPAWRRLRLQVIERAHGWCEHCAELPAEEVHHKTYARLGREHLDDLEALCSACHEIADRSRPTPVATFEARLEGWVRAVYGDDADHLDPYEWEVAAEQFDDWLETHE
jgi:hypothetical protein